MDIQLLKRTEQRINNHFEQLGTILLSPANYDAKNVKIDHLKLYLSFLEEALKRPYNRIAHIYTFLDDPDGLMSARMYPLCFLSRQARDEIIRLYQETERIVATLGVSHSTDVLEEEPNSL